MRYLHTFRSDMVRSTGSVLRAALPALFLVVPLLGVGAFQLAPMSAVIDPSRSAPTTTFEVSNGGSSPIAVELRAATRRIDVDGSEYNDDASDSIQLFPSQLVLRPGASQTVRARWVGAETPDRELPFRVIAEQLPVNLNREQEQGSGVQFMLRYRATLYVRPPDSRAEITVTEIDTDSPEHLTVTVRNDGTRHQLFSRGTVLFEDAQGESREVPLEELEAFTGVNVLPGATRRIRIPRDQMPLEPVEVDFRFN